MNRLENWSPLWMRESPWPWQDGDVGGHLRSVMPRFQIPGVAAAALHEFFLPEGRPRATPDRLLPMYQQVISLARQQLLMLAAYVEVTLAKGGRPRPACRRRSPL